MSASSDAFLFAHLTDPPYAVYLTVLVTCN